MIQPDFRVFKGIGLNQLTHSAKGSTWKDHKYIKKINGVYYYAKDRIKEKQQLLEEQKKENEIVSQEQRHIDMDNEGIRSAEQKKREKELEIKGREYYDKILNKAQDFLNQQISSNSEKTKAAQESVDRYVKEIGSWEKLKDYDEEQYAKKVKKYRGIE